METSNKVKAGLVARMHTFVFAYFFPKETGEIMERYSRTRYYLPFDGVTCYVADSFSERLDICSPRFPRFIQRPIH